MAAAPLKATASYKKQDGAVFLSKDKKTVLWSPANPAGNAPTLKIAVADISNLQKSPDTSAKVSVRIVVQPAATTAPENHVFTFTSTTAKTDQAALVDALRDVIAALKASAAASTPVAAPGTNGAEQSAAMAIAQAVSAGARAAEIDPLSDSRLLADIHLQQSLLRDQPQLRQRFDESFRGKPETITVSQFSAQFWSSRIHMLRAHAVAKSQHQGMYNVLSEVKPKNVDGAMKLNLSREQIQLIFTQHPLVQRVYDDMVPRTFTEMNFWAKFFASKLLKKLNGEQVSDTDAGIPELDKYLNYDENAEKTHQFAISHVPRFIDLEGNEQNHSQKKGNAPDISMRPNATERVPILRVLNSMSEKMMVNVAPSDAETHAPAGMDEDTFNQLQLRDLQRESEDNRVMLKIRDQHSFYAKDKEQKPSMRARFEPRSVIRGLRADIDSVSTLESSVNGGEKHGANATNSIMKSVKLRSLHSAGAGAMDPDLSTTITDSALMTHNTTVEFLHYFWSVFLSGDDSRAGELAKLVETLEKSLERIDAVGTQAEAERQAQIAERKRQVDEVYNRTGKRRTVGKVGGGRQAVEDMLSATRRAVSYAETEYKRILREQTAQNLAAT